MADIHSMIHLGVSWEARQEAQSQPRTSGSEDYTSTMRTENHQSRRETRLGLRSFFGRHKEKPSAEPALEAPPVPRTSNDWRRASHIEFNTQPYSNVRAARSELVMPPSEVQHSVKHKKSATTGTVSTSPYGQATSTSWEAPPLFQAYPHAVKYAQLPACTLPAEALIKMQTPRATLSRREGRVRASLDVDIAVNGLMETEKIRGRNRSHTTGPLLDWTTKIYVLVTPGYLLQYSGEGSFDRLPEKFIQLSKDSAAFASDVIPGRHWVLQVCSGAEETPTPASLLSRLPFRGTEKKETTSFLMVLETARDMESWMSVLRHEIAVLGGKQNLSETGEPKPELDVLLPLSETDRTLQVMRDAQRFSRADVVPSRLGDASRSATRLDVTPERPDESSEQLFDDSSDSVYSQDSDQLDDLKEATYRLSGASSGQGTGLTSVGSSPAPSPVRNSFGSSTGEGCATETALDPYSPRLRPNANMILGRRQSMRQMNQVELQAASITMPRPHSKLSPPMEVETTPAPQPVGLVQNFSVPSGAGRRYSLMRSTSSPSKAAPVAIPQIRMPPPRSLRRPPPSALAINSRPLSFVQDYPSPMTPSLEVKHAPWMGDALTMDAPSQHKQNLHPGAPLRTGSHYQSSHPLSRRLSTQTLSRAVAREQSTIGTEDSTRTVPNRMTMAPPPPPLHSSRPTVETHRHTNSSSLPLGSPRHPMHPEAGRGSPYSHQADEAMTVTRHVAFDANDRLGVPSSGTQKSSSKPGPYLRASRSSQSLRGAAPDKILARKSFAQLRPADIGPPPAPPPTRALPALPPVRGHVRRQTRLM